MAFSSSILESFCRFLPVVLENWLSLAWKLACVKHSLWQIIMKFVSLLFLDYMLLNSQPRSQMRRNFVLIAKLLQAISNKGASQILKEVYMKPLEAFVESRQQILQDFLMKLCNVDDFHSNLEVWNSPFSLHIFDWILNFQFYYLSTTSSRILLKLYLQQGSDRPWKTWKTWKMLTFWKISGKIRETQGILFENVDNSGKLREFKFFSDSL